MTKKWKTWLVVFLAALLVGEGIGAWVTAQGSATVGGVIAWLTRAFLLYWLGAGLFVWREIPWVRKVSTLVVGTAAAVVAVLAFIAGGSRDGVIAVLGIYTMSMGFYLGLQLLRLLLAPGIPLFGVARTLIDEAIRMKIPLVFLVALTLLIPILPFIGDSAERLSYRIQSFITWSMMGVSFLLGVMTIFLAVESITAELRNRQIYITLTKPLGRVQYLMGKWLGIALLDLLLIAVAGVGIYTFTQLLAGREALTMTDRAAVEEQILVSRRAIKPIPQDMGGIESKIDARIAQLRREEPDRYGKPGEPRSRISEKDQSAIMQQVLSKWYSLPSTETRVYVFEGLEGVKDIAQSVQLRFEPKAMGSTSDDFVYLRMRVNGRPYFDPVLAKPEIPPLAEGEHHILLIHTETIDANGRLIVELASKPGRDGQPMPTITFNAKDGLELLYRVDSFEANFVRSMLILWMRLVFLAMLGVMASTFLGFPVACLLCLMVYAAAAGSAYVTESFDTYGAFPKEELGTVKRVLAIPGMIWEYYMDDKKYEAFKIVINSVGRFFLFFVPSFADFNPTPDLSAGRLVSWETVRSGFYKIILIWTVSMGVIAWVIFQRKEIARVIV